jgi:ABC-type transport system involved in cytochrome bd biosynthesis fused ATPase/permease subunit
MKKFLNNIVHSKLGRILDQLFVGFEFFLPKFVLYLIIPTFIFSFMKFFGVQWVTNILLVKLTLFILPIFLLGAFWFIYRTTKLD